MFVMKNAEKVTFHEDNITIQVANKPIEIDPKDLECLSIMDIITFGKLLNKIEEGKK